MNGELNPVERRILPGAVNVYDYHRMHLNLAGGGAEARAATAGMMAATCDLNAAIVTAVFALDRLAELGATLE